MPTRRLTLVLIAVAVSSLWAASQAIATDPVSTGLFDSVAVKGYDPVAYFEAGTPTKGSKKIAHTWNGAEWRFASTENRDLFVADPEAYAPQFGGYCAWAVSQGYTAGIDPEAWKIVDGKLYLNYSKKVQAKWEADIPGFIRSAEGHWPKLLAE